MSASAPYLQPVPSYDDDAFILTERVPRVVIERSPQSPFPRIHEVSAPSLGAARTVCEVESSR